MSDARANFAFSTVATAPSPATSGTTLTVATGQGARFPAAPFNVVVSAANATREQIASGGEVIRVTSKGGGDNWTIARTQEGSSARSIVVGDEVSASITAKMFSDIEPALAVNQSSHGFAVGDVVYYTGSAYAKAKADAVGTAEAVGIVSAVPDSSNFVLQFGGRITGLSGLTAGSVYFLSDATAGLLTTTEPTAAGSVSKPLLVADSTTSGYFFNYRGLVVSSLLGPSYVNLQEQQASGTGGANSTSGSWQTRTINTEQADDAGICSVSANVITLAAGTYRCRATASAYFTSFHKIRLRNTTDSTTLLVGTNSIGDTFNGIISNWSEMSGQFTIAAGKSLEIQSRCTDSRTNGYGKPASLGEVEVYLIAEFWKVA